MSVEKDDVLIDEDDMRDLLEHYSLGEPLNFVRPRGSVYHGIVHVAELTSGKYVIKVFSTHYDETDESRLDYISSVMEQVERVGVRTPLPLRNNSGQRLSRCGIFPAAISRFIEGDDFDKENPSHLQAAGDLLAKYHECLEDFRPRGSTWLGTCDRISLADCRNPVRSHELDTPEERAVAENFDEISARINTLQRELEQCGYPRLPRTIAHFEYVAKHLRMHGDRIVGLLDFEYTSEEARAMDLAIALDDFPCAIRGDKKFDWEKARVFFSAYAAVTPLGPDEIRSIPVMMKAWVLSALVYWIRRVILKGEKIRLFDLDGRIKDDFTELDWLDGNGAYLVDRLSELMK